MNGVVFPDGFQLQALTRAHRRDEFDCGEPLVNDWLASKAWQHQQKHLSITKVLLDETGRAAGYYTLASGQVDFSDLPPELARKLPRRALPVAVLAWLGVDRAHQRRGLGGRLLAQALRDCYEAGKTFAFVAVILDCLNEAAREFYRRWDFEELPGHPSRLYLSAKLLSKLMGANR